MIEPMADIEYFSTEKRPAFVSRFIASGVIMLVAAAANLMLAAWMAVLAIHQSPTPRAAKGLIACAVLQGAYGMGSSAVGVGCLLLKRWSRPCVLAIAWPWLLLGAVNLAVLIVAARRDWFFHNLPTSSTASLLMLAAFVFLYGLVGVGLPLAIVKLLSAEDVRAWIESADTRARWTDSIPLRHLILIGSFVTTSFMEVSFISDPLGLDLGKIAPGLIFLGGLAALADVCNATLLGLYPEAGEDAAVVVSVISTLVVFFYSAGNLFSLSAAVFHLTDGNLLGLSVTAIFAARAIFAFKQGEQELSLDV